MCAPLMKLLRQVFGHCCRQRNGRLGKRPETFLTPYEMDMVPLMLKELDDLDHRFYQMVCYRWFKEATLQTHQETNSLVTVNVDIAQTGLLPSASNNCLGVQNTNCTSSTTTICSSSSSIKLSRTPNFEDFVNEGMALRHLIRILSRTLRDCGTFDELCETELVSYRTQRQQWQSNAPFISTSATEQATRIRSYSTATGTLPSRGRSVGNQNGAYVSSSASSSNSSTFATSPSTATPMPILLLNNEPNDEGEDESQTYENPKSKNHSKFSNAGILRTRPATTIIANRTSSNLESKSGKNYTKRKSTASMKKEKRQAAETFDALFTKLGEILTHQFHTTVIVDGNQKQKQHNENVHDRELKVLIWRHFVQMLIAVLTDRARFPA